MASLLHFRQPRRGGFESVKLRTALVTVSGGLSRQAAEDDRCDGGLRKPLPEKTTTERGVSSMKSPKRFRTRRRPSGSTGLFGPPAAARQPCSKHATTLESRDCYSDRGVKSALSRALQTAPHASVWTCPCESECGNCSRPRRAANDTPPTKQEGTLHRWSTAARSRRCASSTPWPITRRRTDGCSR